MKKIIFKFLFFATLLIFILNAFGENISCPSEDQIKKIKLISAIQDLQDPECWNFFSTTFIHAGIKWNIVFGKFISNVQSPEQALIKGQSDFERASIAIQSPQPFTISGKIICNYMPNGREYWLSAISPPKAEENQN